MSFGWRYSGVDVKAPHIQNRRAIVRLKSACMLELDQVAHLPPWGISKVDGKWYIDLEQEVTAVGVDRALHAHVMITRVEGGYNANVYGCRDCGWKPISQRSEMWDSVLEVVDVEPVPKYVEPEQAPVRRFVEDE